MLSESFIASTLTSTKIPASASLKDVGICIHELQPAAALRSGFKKSSTSTNGLALTSTHVFAAQAEKAVVHVYSRARGNQEATVPFPERIRSVTVADGGILVLGTEGGRLILWETCTGRQVSSSPSHLQPVTSLVVDSTTNFILSGSPDANVHVWSLPNLLSFSKPSPLGHDRKPPNSPIRTLSNHRTPITAVVVGHSCSRNNIAITTAKDSTAIVWDYHTGRILRTFLLPSTALSIAIDPADRAFFVGYETGNVQIVDFYKNPSIQHPLHDVNLQATPSQLLADDQWLPPSTDFGAAECLTLSYDGTKLLSGHRNGNILSWDVARSKYGSTVADYTHPVTNIQMLPPAGFPQQFANDSSTVTVHNVVKPRYDHHMADSLQATTLIPSNYSFNAQLTSLSPQPYVSTSAEKYSSKQVELSEALVHPFFPRFLIDEGLAELSAFDQGRSVNDEAMQSSLLPLISDGDSASSSALASQVQSLEAEIITLKKRLSINETARRNTTDEVVKLRSDLVQWQDYANELQSRQERSQQEKVLARARKEERDLKRRQAWFEAEKRGENGDAIVRKMKAEDGSDTSDSEARSNDPN